MLLTLNVESLNILIEIECWKNETNKRIEFYIIYAENEEIFLNVYKRENEDCLYEHSASEGLPENIKDIIKHRLTTLPGFPYCID